MIRNWNNFSLIAKFVKFYSATLFKISRNLHYFFRCPKPIEEDTDLWEVSGLKTSQNGQQLPFKYWTKKIVLATGSYDKANDLEKPGENLDFVVHSLKAMEDKLVEGQDRIQQPVVIVGAGLSAADAIIAALNKGFSVIHVFR